MQLFNNSYIRENAGIMLVLEETMQKKVIVVYKKVTLKQVAFHETQYLNSSKKQQ